MRMADAGPPDLPRSFIGQDQPGSRSLVVGRHGTRWVIPLDSPKVATAALSIYRPKSLREVLAWYTARRAMSIMVLSHQGTDGVGFRRDLAAALGQSLGRQDVVFAAAVPQPDRATVAAITPSGQLLAFGKLGASEAAGIRIEREHTALQMIGPHIPSGAVHVPEVLFRGVLEGVEALLVSPVGGRPEAVPGRLRPRYLHALASLVRQTGERPLRRLVPQPAPIDAAWRSLVAVVSERLAVREDIPVCPALVHGDFAPWNVGVHGSGVAAYDWEDAAEEGAPFWDLWHFAVQSSALLGHWSVEDLVDAAVRLRGRLGRAVRSYAGIARVPVELAAPVLAAYLAASDSVVGRHGDLSRPDRRHGLQFRAGVLARLMEVWR
jgi:hypothetical protein